MSALADYGRQLALAAPPLTPGQVEQAARILATVEDEAAA
jgi:hypothetical protein